MSKAKHLKIFENKTKELEENILLWNEYSSCKQESSILDYIEENSKRIRKKFLKYHNNISNLKYQNKNISDIFCINKKFSFWWLAQFNEKNLFLSNSILINLVKIIALEEITSKKKIKKISLYFLNDNLRDILELYCKKKNIKFYFYKQKNRSNLFQSFKINKTIKFILPKIIYSFLYFILFISSRIVFLNRLNIKNIKFDKIFFTYSSNLNFDKLKIGEYYSNYWGKKFSSKSIKNSLWVNLYVENKIFSLNRKVKFFKKISQNNNKYIFLENFLSVRIFLKVLYIWIKIIFKYIRIKKSIELSLENSGIPVFKIIENDLNESFLGASALINLYHFYLFKELSHKIESIEKAFYLNENLTWEKSMIFNLRNKVNKIYGIQHAALRFWDLKFSEYPLIKMKKYLSPNYFCSNGDDGFKKLLEFKINKKRIKKVEAIRYEYLFKKKIKFNINTPKKKILIIGDNSRSSNFDLSETINYLKEIKKDKFFTFYVKNHPVMSVDHLLKIKFKLTKKNLVDLRKNFDFAIVANNTSAVIDLHLLGFKVLSLVEKNKLNMSPLKGSKNITFLYDKNKIYELIKRKLDLKYKNKNIKNNFFYYSKSYTMWDNLLKKQ